MLSGRHLLVEVSLGDSDKMRVHSSHDSDEGGLSGEGRKHTTKFTWTSHIEQVLVEGEREGGREGGRKGEEGKGREGAREGGLDKNSLCADQHTKCVPVSWTLRCV